ncbi:MAG: 50S ribosomal protein L22 [Planctomycetota bacterium]|nr:50S ribosomal protein L22 [Planctomycetota bacterium]
MRIRGNKLKAALERAEMTVDRAAEALAEPGFAKDDAARAIRNWMAGRDHPRCRASRLKKLAGVLKVDVKDLAAFTSEVRYHRGSPRKAALLATLIRGKNVDQALNLLAFTTKRAAVNMRKCLSAAVSDAEQAECDVTRLYVSESRVDYAAVMKRFQPKDRGRAHPILKPLSHITISVEERPSRG